MTSSSLNSGPASVRRKARNRRPTDDAPIAPAMMPTMADAVPSKSRHLAGEQPARSEQRDEREDRRDDPAATHVVWRSRRHRRSRRGAHRAPPGDEQEAATDEQAEQEDRVADIDLDHEHPPDDDPPGAAGAPAVGRRDIVAAAHGCRISAAGADLGEGTLGLGEMEPVVAGEELEGQLVTLRAAFAMEADPGPILGREAGPRSKFTRRSAENSPSSSAGSSCPWRSRSTHRFWS